MLRFKTRLGFGDEQVGFSVKLLGKKVAREYQIFVPTEERAESALEPVDWMESFGVTKEHVKITYQPTSEAKEQTVLRDKDLMATELKSSFPALDSRDLLKALDAVTEIKISGLGGRSK